MKQAVPIPATLRHLVFLPTRENARSPSIIALHGRGADENDLADLVLALEFPDVIVITPRAPLASSFGGYAWYELGEEGVPESETFKSSLQLLEKFVSEIKSGYPLDPEQIMLLGFSQGTVMAYAEGLLHPEAFRGIAALSGYIPHRSGLPLKLSNLNGFPVFISHGSDDPVIPARLGREAAELLKHAGANTAYHEYPTVHAVTEETIRDLREWVRTLTRTQRG